MNLVDYTDKAIMKLILNHALQINPWLKLGENMTSSNVDVHNGKIIKEDESSPPANYIDGLPIPPNLKPPIFKNTQNISAQPIRLSLGDIANFNVSKLQQLNFKLSSGKYIHGYRANLEARAWLEKYNIGDMVSVGFFNPVTFKQAYTEIPLTQDIIDNVQIVFYFALSDQ